MLASATRVLAVVVDVFGAVLCVLAWLLPRRLQAMRDHGGAEFTPGFRSLVEALTSLIAAFSILAALAAVLVVLPVQQMRSTLSVVLGVIAYTLFTTGIVTSVYCRLKRPLSGTAPTERDVYLALRLLLLGLGFAMFTLASVIWL